MQHRTSDAPVSPNKWTFFGGHVEEDETFEEALKREAREELEYAITNPRQLTDFTRETDGKKIVFKVFLEEYNKQPLTLHEGQAMKWVSISELVKYLEGEYYEHIIKLLQ